MADKGPLSDVIKHRDRVVVAALVPAADDEDRTLVAVVEGAVRDAGATLVGTVIQRRGVSRSPKRGGVRAMCARVPLRAATLFGKGKVEELAELVKSAQADMVVYVNRLSGTQKRNLERATGAVVVSSFGLIDAVTDTKP
jgi:hypothetical protein